MTLTGPTTHGQEAGGQCGGIVPGVSVGEELGGFIAGVEGLPGRLGRPLAARASGLGIKETAGGQLDDGFQFPTDTEGFSTRCRPGEGNLKKVVQSYKELSFFEFPNVETPNFADPPCLETPGACAGFCAVLNGFMYPDCYTLYGDRQRGIGCAQWCMKETCTDGWTSICSTSLSELTGGGFADSPKVPAYRDFDGNEVPEETEIIIELPPAAPINCVPCEGEECRCGIDRTEKDPACILGVPSDDVGRPDMQNLQPQDAALLLGCRRASIRGILEQDERLNADRQLSIDSCLDALSEVTGSVDPESCGFRLDDIGVIQPGTDPLLGPCRDVLALLRPSSVTARELPGPARGLVQSCRRAADRELQLQREQGFEGEPQRPTEECLEILRTGIMTVFNDEGEPRDEPADDSTTRACRASVAQGLLDLPSTEQDDADRGRQCVEQIGRGIGTTGGVYASFFRQYAFESERQALTEVAPNDRNRQEGRAACYGFYREFDPLKHRTEEMDLRCVLDLDASDYPSTQLGRGETATSSSSAPFSTLGRSGAPEPTLQWFRGAGGGFSLLHPPTEGDATSLLEAVFQVRSLDRGGLKALGSPQGTLTPAFDDTGTGRTVASWWQTQQTTLARSLAEPQIRLFLPATWPFGNPTTDPLFQRREIEADPLDLGAPLEVQLRAGEDVAGLVVQSLESSLLGRLQEERLPVIVPLGSPSELRAIAQEWCRWAMQKDKTLRDCSSAGEAQPMIERLEAYADRIEDVQSLRAEHLEVLSALTANQNDVWRGMEEWRENVTELVESWRGTLATVLALRERWQEVEQAMTTFGERTNRPWCMNQRFTLPITSLVDPWLPGRPDLDARPFSFDLTWTQPDQAIDPAVLGRLQTGTGNLLGTGLPFVRSLPLVADLTLDLSRLKLGTGATVRIPVIVPLPLALDLGSLLPPGTGETRLPTPPPELASLDPIRQALAAARQPLASIGVEAPALPEPPALPDATQLAQLEQALEASEQIIEEMNETYETFWKTVGPEAAAERANLQCAGWASGQCQHVEMDLLERVMRIGSRPMALLDEDLQTVSGLGRSHPNGCNPFDDVCPPLFPVAEPPASGWQLTGQGSDESVGEQTRKTLRSLTLPPAVGQAASSSLPPYAVPLRDALRGLSVPTDVPLGPSSRSSDS